MAALPAAASPPRAAASGAAPRLLALAAAAVLLLGLAAPFLVSRSAVQDLFFILTMLTLAQNWNFLAGTGGLVSVGQQAFVGTGAYAMFAAVILGGLDPLAGILAGGVAALALSVPTAFFLFRLQGAYFAIGSWVVAEVVRLLFAQWKVLGGGTGTSLPREATRDVWGTAWIADLFGVRAAAALDILGYIAALVLALLTVGAIYAILRSRLGLGLAAVRDNAEAARAVGVSPRRMKALIYCFTAFATGLCGALIYVQKARISPDAAFSVTDWTAYVIFIVVIGGIGTIEGPILGTLVFFALQKLLADYGSWYLLILGLLGIAVMLFAPRGLWGLFADRTGIELFPVRRHLPGAPPAQTGRPHG